MEELERKPKGNLLRKLKRLERAGLYNVLRSIYEDSLFVRELREDILPGIPVLANLRCGAWYSPRFDGDCYFKSTDGHCGKWQFSFTRLNAHVARTAAGAGGALLVDSTKSAVKRFPDSFARTVPIWCGVLNRAVAIARGEGDDRDWDREVHLPSWIPDSERSALEPLVEGWSQKLAKTQPGLLEGGLPVSDCTVGVTDLNLAAHGPGAALHRKVLHCVLPGLFPAHDAEGQ